MNIVQLDDQNNDRWDEFVRNSPNPSVFHLTGWKRVLEKTFGYQATYWFAEENQRISGVLPLFLIKNFLGPRVMISVPFAVYGGIIARDQKTQETLLEVGRNLVHQYKASHLELRHEKQNELGLPIKDLYVTFQKQLFSDVEKNFDEIPRKQRRMIRQALKQGLKAKVGNEQIKEFYNIYAHSVRNLGTPVFPYKYFENLLEEFGDWCKVLGVWHKEKMVAGVMTFFFNDTVIPYYGGALKPYLRLAVNDFMYWELMRFGTERGYSKFDFGRSRIGTGAFHFKRHWGFEPEPLPYQFYLPNQGKLPDTNPSNPKYKIQISLWKKLPVNLTKVIGPSLIRYFP